MTNQLDKFSSAYSNDFEFAFDNNIILNWYPERIMRLCEKSDSLLELGIGHGYTTQRFSNYFAKHVVVDGSPNVIRMFHEQYPDCKASIVNAYFEDFQPNGLFNVIVLGFILEHVSNPQLILERFKQFLAPGGKCFVAVPNGESLHRRFGLASGMLDDLMRLGSGDRELGHERIYSVKTLTDELNRAGYTVVKKEGIFLKPFTTSQLQQLKLDTNILQGMCEVGIDYPELSCGLLFEARIGA